MNLTFRKTVYHISPNSNNIYYAFCCRIRKPCLFVALPVQLLLSIFPVFL